MQNKHQNKKENYLLTYDIFEMAVFQDNTLDELVVFLVSKIYYCLQVKYSCKQCS